MHQGTFLFCLLLLRFRDNINYTLISFSGDIISVVFKVKIYCLYTKKGAAVMTFCCFEAFKRDEMDVQLN